MARSAIQFQKDRSLSAFQRLYGTEEPLRPPWRRPAGPMGSEAPAAMALSMA